MLSVFLLMLLMTSLCFQVTTSLPKAASFSSLADSATVVTSAVATLYAGQRLVL